jgi:hypothetical protein
MAEKRFGSVYFAMNMRSTTFENSVAPAKAKAKGVAFEEIEKQTVNSRVTSQIPTRDFRDVSNTSQTGSKSSLKST